MNTESNSTPLPPTFSELLDYAEGRLAEADHRRVAEFIAEHPQAVEAEWAWVQDFLHKARSVKLHPLPDGLEDRLISIHPAKPAEAPLEMVSGWMKHIRRVVAELVDPGIQPDFAAAGLRTKSFEANARQWVFKTEEFDVLVNALERPDQRFDLHGQVLPVTGEAAGQANSAQLLRDDREIGLATVDEFGEFLIPGVATGAYSLVIAGEAIEVVCAPLAFSA
jgi:hypothetical protein